MITLLVFLIACLALAGVYACWLRLREQAAELQAMRADLEAMRAALAAGGVSVGGGGGPPPVK